MFAQLFGSRRPRQAPEMNASSGDNDPTKDNDDDAKQPPTKKIKTEENEEGNGGGHGGTRPAVDPVGNAKADIFAQVTALMNPFLLQNVTFYLNNHEEWQLAACNRWFYAYFAHRDRTTFESIYINADPKQQTAFLERTMVQARRTLSDEGWKRFTVSAKPKPSLWKSMWTWMRGERPERWLGAHRYFLHCAYKVPVDVQQTFVFGPSCSSGDRLYCLSATGVVVTFDSEPKPVDYELTRRADPGFLSQQRYSFLFDDLCYCVSNDNVDNDKGFLVLQHRPGFQGTNDIRVLDLSRTDQDIGREGSATGIDHRRITPSDDFHGNNSEVIVSELEARIFFINISDGTFSIECYDMVGQLIASARKALESTAWQYDHFRVINAPNTATTSVITQDKLLIMYRGESGEQDDAFDYGFGIYVFRTHDLSFCGYTPFFRNYEITGVRISKDWLFYYRPGTQNAFALRITGGNTGEPTTMNMDCFAYGEWFLAGNHIYAVKERHEEGCIEIDRICLMTGNKIHALTTFLPWQFDDDGSAFLPFAGPAEPGAVRRLFRTVVTCHIVGNKVAFLLSSVGCAKNSIVAFALPPLG